MTIELRPYVNFPGTTREAMEYYHSIFGGELQIATFGDFHALPEGSPNLDKVMNAELHTEYFTLMAADVIDETPIEVTFGNSVNLALVASGVDALEVLSAAFDKLAADPGTKVEMPLSRVMWGAVFGSLTDRYGRPWMMNIDVPAGQAGKYEDATLAQDPTDN